MADKSQYEVVIKRANACAQSTVSKQSQFRRSSFEASVITLSSRDYNQMFTFLFTNLKAGKQLIKESQNGGGAYLLSCLP